MKRFRKPLTSWLRRMGRRMSRASWTARVAAGLMAALTIGGLVWLAADLSAPQWVPVLDRPLTGDDLAEAQRLLAEGAVRTRADGGRLLVLPDAGPRARAILTREGLAHADAAGDDAPADEGDLWQTHTQAAHRRRQAKMARLGHLIETFPPVRKASVLFEPGEPRRIGLAAVAPTAAVFLSLRSGAEVDRKLLAAIADLVSRSISGMTRDRVRIVDSRGRSHRLSEVSPAEAHYVERIESVLRYVPHAIVHVRAVAGDSGPRCSQAWVSVPRSYLRAAATPAADPNASFEEASETVMARIRQQVLRAIGAAETAAVTVDWYHDAPPMAASPAVEGAADGPAAARVSQIVWGVLGGCALLTGGWILLRPRLRRSHRPAGSAEIVQGDGPSRLDAGPDPLGVLQLVSAEDLLKFLEAEHPQTIAVVLSQLPSERAAGVLCGLSPQRQVDVSRRIANLEKVAPETVRDVGEELAVRLSDFVADRGPALGGEEKLADLLRRAGGATERNVLTQLAGTEPGLADSLRTRMFAFEDIASMPAWRLRGILDAIDSAELALALRIAGKQSVRRVLSCLSGPGAKRVRVEMEQIGPVRLSDVEAAQQRVLDALKGLEDRQYIAAAGSRESELLA